MREAAAVQADRAATDLFFVQLDYQIKVAMRVPLGLGKIVADEVCLLICQGLSVTKYPVIDLDLEGKGILVGIVLCEEFIC
jgi:hypothetical protein